MSAEHARAARVAASAEVHPDVMLEDGVVVWDGSVIRQGATIGEGTTIGRDVYVDHDVHVGRRCKVQNNALLYWPAEIADGVFIGPGAILTNDRYPRAVTPEGMAKGAGDWTPEGVAVGVGATIGAGAVVLAGTVVGNWALVAAGAVVVRDVPDLALVAGNPAKRVGWVGKGGRRLVPDGHVLVDPSDGTRYREATNSLERLT